MSPVTGSPWDGVQGAGDYDPSWDANLTEEQIVGRNREIRREIAEQDPEAAASEHGPDGDV